MLERGCRTLYDQVVGLTVGQAEQRPQSGDQFHGDLLYYGRRRLAPVGYRYAGRTDAPVGKSHAIALLEQPAGALVELARAGRLLYLQHAG